MINGWEMLVLELTEIALAFELRTERSLQPVHQESIEEQKLPKVFKKLNFESDY
jgi:hypothetical protein